MQEMAKTNVVFSSQLRQRKQSLSKSIDDTVASHPLSWAVLCFTKRLLHQPCNVGFTSKAQHVGTLLFRARSLQVTGVHTQNFKLVQQPNNKVVN
jgi:hypothetical protein